jgi:hypothetical protein
MLTKFSAARNLLEVFHRLTGLKCAPQASSTQDPAVPDSIREIMNFLANSGWIRYLERAAGG